MKSERDMTTAITLMRMALGLLDRAGATESACYLQQALDTARGVPAPRTIEEAKAQLAMPEARAILARMVRASEGA